jgi:hypothetical protein
VHRRGGKVKFFNLPEVPEEFLFEVVFTPGLARLVSLRVAIFAVVAAAGINVYAISMSGREVFLVGEGAIPLDYSRTSYSQNLFL